MPEKLEGLYQAYVQYTADLAAKRGEGLLSRDFAEFSTWWHGLPEEVQHECATRYMKTFAVVQKEEDRAIAEVIEKYKHPIAKHV